VALLKYSQYHKLLIPAYHISHVIDIFGSYSINPAGPIN